MAFRLERHYSFAIQLTQLQPSWFAAVENDDEEKDKRDLFDPMSLYKTIADDPRFTRILKRHLPKVGCIDCNELTTGWHTQRAKMIKEKR